MVYSLQHLIFGVANAAAVPVVVGTALGLGAGVCFDSFRARHSSAEVK